MTTIILDTDIGTDVDDILALSLALRSPEITLAAITVVYGDVDLRARMVVKTLDLAGSSSIPIGRGIRLPLLRQRPIHWDGHEGHGILDGSEPTPAMSHAVNLMSDLIRAQPGEITLVPIGPLTNLAALATMEPDLVGQVKQVVLMGGMAGRSDDFNRGPTEHNIHCDPEAASIVFGAGWPIRMVGLDVTLQTRLRRDHLTRLADHADPLATMLADQARRYMDFRQRDFTYLHDPLAVATIIDPSLVETRPMHVAVELHGSMTSGATIARTPTADLPANAEVCLGVDNERAVALFLSRVAP